MHDLRVDEGRRLVNAERSAVDHAFSVAWRQVGEQFAAVVVHAGSHADDDLVVEVLRTPSNAQTRRKSPLPSGEGGFAYTSARKKLVITCNDQTVRSKGVRGIVIGVERRIKIKDAAVLLGEPAVPIPAQPGRQRDIGTELKLILDIKAGLAGPIIAVGVTLEKFGGGKVVVGVDQSLNELGKIGRGNDALVGSTVTSVELRVGIVAAEIEGCWP